MKSLARGSTGAIVRRWQQFLIGQGFDPKGADGEFGKDTEKATIEFQHVHGLPDTGVVDNRTFGQAQLLGMPVVDESEDEARSGPNWPARPDFAPLTSTQERQRIFGTFSYVHAPKPDDYEHIRVTDGWDTANIETFVVPELAKALGTKGRVSFHKKAKPQLLALWRAWDAKGLLDRVLSWEGAYNPRFVRGKAQERMLSNHAFGSAFDINYKWNRLGATPALLGEKGCVRELVRLANKNGFYWGGHFEKRPDGMHFEVARLLQ